MQAVLLDLAPGTPVVDLLSLAPGFSPKPAAYLLAALAQQMPRRSLFLCVIDPGVGSERRGLVLQTEDYWYVGPDNGLLAVAARRQPEARAWEIDWRPEQLSSSFHGRDLFAPVAAAIARGESPVGRGCALDSLVGWGWPEELAEILFIDHYGNAYTGLLAAGRERGQELRVGPHRLGYARTFSEVASGQAFWYENSCGLVEVAVNGAPAAARLGLEPGQPVIMDARG
jgi:S-adenosylmethionine hydrolase